LSTHNISKNGSLLNRAVLVLNTNYAPLEICSARRAICLYYLEKVEILIDYEDKVHSPSVTLNIPSVVKLKDFVRHNSMELILSRKNIFHRDNYTCQYCGSKSGPHTIDHIIPRERGGIDTWENLVTACAPCNIIKGNRSIEEAGMVLRKRPIRPNRIHHFQQYVGINQGEWRPFLFMELLN
jgi:5-methylcytosine-specific restriction endonuclease McrA